jgi:4-diphosphocytidyl-2-C-methyl-D-erythritol kinase
MKRLALPSPAKINLFLHVVGRRSDGYHLLQTAFQFIDLCDEMVFKARKHPGISLHAKDLNVLPEENLVMKAACLLQKRAKKPRGIDIFLKKNIPIGAGLGGGSSNAATTLLALNTLWNLNLRQEEIASIGLSLGADVPIFLQGRASFAEGIGEKLQTIEPLEKWVLLVIPSCQVSTEKIFSDSQLTRNTPPITIKEFFAHGGHNDCEPVARRYFPEIVYALDHLNRYAVARLTGTGGAIFALFEDKAAALAVAEKMPTSLTVVLVKGLNYSPLHEAVSLITGLISQ